MQTRTDTRSIRLDETLHMPLQEEADEYFEGNLSFLVRLVLRNHIKERKEKKNQISPYYDNEKG
jgi:hypothetical protein